MPDATITSTESTFGTISGTFAADQSTVTGTITGIITGTLSGSVGVPGPAGAPGVGVPAGGSSGQYLQKVSGVDYATDWVTLNLSAYLTKAGNLAGLTDLSAARDNLQLGTSYSPVFAGVQITGAGSSVANLGATFLTLNQSGHGQFTIQPSQGIVFPDATIQTTAFTTSQLSAYLAKASNLSDLASTSTARTNLGLGSLAVFNDAPSDGSQYARKNAAWEVVTTTPDFISSVSSPLAVTTGNLTIDLSAYAPISSPVFTGDARAVTPTFGDNDTSISTTAFVQAALAGGTAVARNLEVEVRNQSGSTIAAGSIVYISGATGNKPLITLAQANNDANSAQTIGFVKTSIANNGTGFVIVRGELENIDTSALTEGVQLYLSPTTPGTWTTTKPSAPQHLVYVGIVIRSHPTLGTILVAVQNGYELHELHDVALSSEANNDLLAYESSTDLWKNKTFSALGLLTSANAASTYAPKASPALTGNVTITSNSTGPALFIEQAGTGNILTLHDQASDTTFVAIDQNGKINTIPSTTANAGFNIPHGTAPTTPVNGDIWTTTTGLFMRQNGFTKTYANYNDASVFSNANQTLGSSTAAGTINVGTGATISGSTKTVNIGTAGVAGSFTFVNVGSTTGTSTTTVQGSLTTTGTSVNIGSTTATQSINIGAIATSSGNTKTIDIGGGGVSGSTTSISIGSSVAGVTSTTTLQGITNGVTEAVDTNNTELATTAFVVGQAASATPLVNGTAAVGTSLRYARADHVHPTDTTRAAVDSQAFTGTPSLPTGTIGVTQTAGNNTTALATTAFVTTADNLKANIASPTFTGAPTAPTATAGTNTTQLATTAFVTAAVPAFATTAEINSPASTTKVVAPFDVVRMITNRAVFDTQASSPIFSTSGTGAEGYKQSSDRQLGIGTPNAGIAGWGQLIYETQTGGWGLLGAKRGATMQTQDWNKRIYMTGSTVFISMGDANTTARLMLGGRTSATSGNPTKQSIGWRLTGGGSNPLVLVTYGWNGSALVVTETTSTFTPVLNQTFDWAIYHAPNVANPATSFCYLYVNDVLVATGINSPADATVTNNYFVQTCESTSSIATRMAAFILPTKIWWSKS
jgi:hypothetical protein